jgi:hypothetical protein
VIGRGSVKIIIGSTRWEYKNGEMFQLNDFMECQIPQPSLGIPPDIWLKANAIFENDTQDNGSTPPKMVFDLLNQRQAAREKKDWKASDELREKIRNLGWQVRDTPEGQQLSKQ